MTGLFSLIFIISCVGIWYFIKRKPDSSKRNIAIGLAAISFALVGILGSGDDEKQVAETATTTTESIKESESSSSNSVVVELKLDNEELEVDEEGNAVITGTTNPGASVSVGLGIIGDSVEADKDGKFSLNHSLTGDKDEELTINSRLDGGNTSAKIIVKPNAKVLAQKQEEEKATQEAAASKEKEETEAAAAEANLPREYANAKQSAIDYLNYTSFSKEGLYDQLIYEQYPDDAARYAVDNIDVDWKSQAFATAQDYLDYSSFSDSGLYDQLIYEKFTPEEAQYAIDNLN